MFIQTGMWLRFQFLPLRLRDVGNALFSIYRFFFHSSQFTVLFFCHIWWTTKLWICKSYRTSSLFSVKTVDLGENASTKHYDKSTISLCESHFFFSVFFVMAMFWISCHGSGTLYLLKSYQHHGGDFNLTKIFQKIFLILVGHLHPSLHQQHVKWRGSYLARSQNIVSC